MRPSCYLFLCLPFFFNTAVPAQQGNNYHLEYLSTDDGLPSNGIKGLQWDDSTGFLWIATEAGIVRYNGIDLKIYSKEDEPRVTNDRMLFMIKNKSGKIYTADLKGNLFRVQKNQLRFLEKKQTPEQA